MVELFANSGDLDQRPRSTASDLGLHRLPITLFGSPDYYGVIYYCVYKHVRWLFCDIQF